MFRSWPSGMRHHKWIPVIHKNMLPPSSRSEIGRVDGAQLGQEEQHEMREKLRLVGSRTVVSHETFHHEEKMAFFKFTDWEVGTEKTALFEG